MKAAAEADRSRRRAALPNLSSAYSMADIIARVPSFTPKMA